jgi:hypothetical protein
MYLCFAFPVALVTPPWLVAQRIPFFYYFRLHIFTYLTAHIMRIV